MWLCDDQRMIATPPRSKPYLPINERTTYGLFHAHSNHITTLYETCLPDSFGRLEASRFEIVLLVKHVAMEQLFVYDAT